MNARKMTGMAGMAVVAILLLAAGAGTAQADTDTFGSGANSFNIDFVTISGDAGDLGSWPAGSGYTFTGVYRNDYRMGTYEITNAQWTKFKVAYGAVTGTPSGAYDRSRYFGGTDVPTNRVSWYEAAQFVNYLNTITNNHVAYNFTGTIHTGDYALATWSAAEADNGTNLYRHKDAKYYLPTEDEWVKAGYWNGTTSTLQTYATKAGESLTKGNGTSGTGWNYYDSGYATNPARPWNVGSGSEELNGTRDMMGNVWEWMESPYSDTGYGTGSNRGMRGGSYISTGFLASSYRSSHAPYLEDSLNGFRVASEVPEPASPTPRMFGLCIGQRDGFFLRGDKGAQAVHDKLSARPIWAAVSMGNEADPLVYSQNFEEGIDAAVKSRLNAMQVKPGDTFVFYFNGHGGPLANPSGEPGNETPVTIRGESNTEDEWLSLGLSDDDLYVIFSEPKWQDVRKVFLLDTCHGGGFTGTSSVDVGDLEKLANCALFASATEEGNAYAVPIFMSGAGMGIWTKEFLLPALDDGGMCSAGLIEYIASLLDAAESRYAGQECPLLDINEPGAVALFSGLGVMQSFSTDFDTSQPLLPVPEPGSLALLVAGGAALLMRRRRKGVLCARWPYRN